MKRPKRRRRRREPDHRWLLELVEIGFEIGLLRRGVPPEEQFRDVGPFNGLQGFLAMMAKALVDSLAADGSISPGEPTAFEFRTDHGAGPAVATFRVAEGGQTTVTFPNNLTIGFRRDDVAWPDDVLAAMPAADPTEEGLRPLGRLVAANEHRIRELAQRARDAGLGDDMAIVVLARDHPDCERISRNMEDAPPDVLAGRPLLPGDSALVYFMPWHILKDSETLGDNHGCRAALDGCRPPDIRVLASGSGGQLAAIFPGVARIGEGEPEIVVLP
jgi:hypothetical protein